MDAAPERDFLTEFIDSLSNEEEKHEQREQNCTTPLCNEEVESDVWSDIADALNQSVDTENTRAETRLGTTVSFREKIEASLHRQQLDGFLNHQDIAELRYIADLWTGLLHSTSSHTIGCNFVKCDIITILLNCTNCDRSQIVSS